MRKILLSLLVILAPRFAIAQVPIPMNLTATVQGTSVTLTWTSPDSGRRVSFLVSRKAGSTGAWSQIATTGAQNYIDGALQPATYFYRVREKNGNRYSDYSTVVSVAIGPPTGGISQTLALSSPTIQIGQTLTGTAIVTNNSQTPVTVNQIVITSRPPGGTNSGGPYDNLAPTAAVTTIAAGGTSQLVASRAFTTSDPTGSWYAFVTYQDTSGIWHDGSNVPFSVVAPANQPPIVNAGPPQTITLPASATLSGTASGSGTVTTTWSVASGPGTVVFGNVNALNTIAGFSTFGSYVLQLTGINAYGTSTSNVIITVLNSGSTDSRPRDSLGWVTCSGSFVPLSDQQAVSFITSKAEVIPGNASPNAYRPSGTELSAFLNNERDINNQLPAQLNPYNAYVTGWYTGTTDEIIQWAAIKWGIPPDWLRAEYTQESVWNMSQLGDSASVGSSSNYPPQSRIDGTHAYQSLGFSQVKWNHPDVNDSGIGTEPLRWKSTAFNADYQAARVRQFFDNPMGSRSGWGDASYVACQNWLSIGGWFQAYPWNNSGQNTYVGQVQTHLANRDWPK